MHSRFEMSLMGEKNFFLRLQIHQSLHDIFINQAKYALEILHKHDMEKGQSIGTPMATKPKLDANLSGNPVDQTDYRSKIGSLMYLTSSRPDIVRAMLITPDALILIKALLEEYNSKVTMKMEILLEPTSNKLLVESRKLKHKDKDFANSDIQDLPSRCQVYQGILLASFQDDAKYEHGGQDTRSQGRKRRSRQKDKDLKISDEKTKSKDNDKRLKIKDHKA
nr:uncharacterized mitochondrial protein AtMg00810-like [Tanacetum cinerariifolium]